MKLMVERLPRRAGAPARRLILTVVLVCLTATGASAQGGATSSVSGVVKDTAGGVIPGASVVVTSNATETKFEAVSNTHRGVLRAGAVGRHVYA